MIQQIADLIIRKTRRNSTFQQGLFRYWCSRPGGSTWPFAAQMTACGHVGLGLGVQNLFAFVSYRNKIIWVGIASQIIIALILSYGLGSIQALNFTMIR